MKSSPNPRPPSNRRLFHKNRKKQLAPHRKPCIFKSKHNTENNTQLINIMSKTEKPSISTKELNILAYEEKVLDDLAQCGAVSRHFPELAQATMEAKRGLEAHLTEEGIELGSVVA